MTSRPKQRFVFRVGQEYKIHGWELAENGIRVKINSKSFVTGKCIGLKESGFPMIRIHGYESYEDDPEEGYLDFHTPHLDIIELIPRKVEIKDDYKEAFV